MKLRTLLIATAAIGLTAACGPSPSSAEVSDVTTDAILAALTEGSLVSDGHASLESTNNLANTLDTLGSVSGMGSVEGLAPSADPEVFARAALPTLAAIFPGVELEAMLNARLIERPVRSDEATEAMIEDFGDYLRERIFTEENVESQWGGETIFRLTGEDLCEADPVCIATVDDYELRIRARYQDEGIELAFLLGPNRHAPFSLYLAENEVAVALDLGATKNALLYLSDVSGTTIVLPDTMVGVVEARLTKHGEGDVSLAFSVVQAVELEVADENDDVRSFSTGAKTPAVEYRLRAAEKRLTVSVDVGPTHFEAPYTDFAPEGTAGEVLAYHLGGASLTMDATDGQTDFTISDIGLGDEQSYLSLDGVRVAQYDLNETMGRRFDLTVTPQPSGHPILDFHPGLDVRLTCDLEALAADGIEVDANCVNDDYALELSGATPALSSVPADGDFTGGIKVESGELSLTSVRHGDSIVVTEGLCVVKNPEPPMGGHPIIDAMMVTSCP